MSVNVGLRQFVCCLVVIVHSMRLTVPSYSLNSGRIRNWTHDNVICCFTQASLFWIIVARKLVEIMHDRLIQ